METPTLKPNVRLLLVEDDPFVRRIYQRLFSQSNYQVEEATNGQEALDMLSKSKYDLILLDLMLPMVSGVDVLKKLKSDDATKDIPVLVLTNVGEDEMEEVVLKLGATGYMIKSEFSPNEVLSEVNKYLSPK